MSAHKLEAAKRVSQKLLAMSSDELKSALDAQEGSFYKVMFDRFFDLSHEPKKETSFDFMSVSEVILSSKVTVKYNTSISFDEVVIHPENEESCYGAMAA